MAQLALSLLSMLELFLGVFFFLAGYVRPEWIWWMYLGILLVEPAGYYLFAGYIAMRGITTTIDLVTMVLILPPYYLSLLLMVVLRLDMHASPFLSNMIYYEFSPMSFPKQLTLHVYCVSGPLLALTGVTLIFEEMTAVGVVTLLSLCWSVYYFQGTVERFVRRRSVPRRGGLNHSIDHNRSVSESDSDLTYLNYTPLLSFEDARQHRR